MRAANQGLFWTMCCAFVLAVSAGLHAQTGASIHPIDQPSASISQASSDNISSPAFAELPDSPGAALAKGQEPASQAKGSAQSTNASSNPSIAVQNSAQDQKSQRPVGTAAAEAPKVSGVTAAEPAGVAIAPAKQKRVRTIVLKVGAMIGAGAAIGTVIALSEGTSSKPPGAH